MPACEDEWYPAARLRGVTAWMVAALLVVVALPACAPKATRRQTDVMEKIGKVDVSAVVLRARVNDLADRFAGRIEESADAIEGASRTVDLRQRALALKVDLIPAVYTAAYRVDPLTAAIDVWVLAFQFDTYVRTTAGGGAFGPQQELLHDAARDVLAAADSVFRSIVVQPQHFDEARRKVAAWAGAHPVSHTFGSRPSGAPVLAELETDELNAFLAVGSASDTLDNLSERLNTYAAQLPKQARWHSEILASKLAEEMVAAVALDRTMADVHDVGDAARSASSLLNDLSRVFDVERTILEAERRAVLAGVDQQRLESLDFVTTERHALLASVREERLALVAALRQERIEAINGIDAIKTRAIDTSLAGLKDLVDYAFWRVAVLLFGLLCLGALLAAAALWHTLRRTRAPAATV